MSHPVTAITPANVIKAIELAATGHTQSAIGKVLKISVRSVQRILSEPSRKQAVAELRQVLSAKTVQSVQVVTPALHVWLKEVIEGKVDARDADMLSRALLNLEKVAASASGENRPQAQPPVTVNVVSAPGWLKPKPAGTLVEPVSGAALGLAAKSSVKALPAAPEDYHL
jgi:hypothetical protein